MMEKVNEVICGSEKLDCTAVIEWVKGHIDCTKKELLESRAFCDLVKSYSEKIKAQYELEWAIYEWFADVVLGQLIRREAIHVKFGVWGI